MSETHPDWRQASYDAHAAGYPRLLDPTLAGAAERLAELGGARPGMRLLDLATGTGSVARAATRRGARVVAVDPSPGMLAVGREHSPHIDFQLADALALPFEAEEFDAVTCGLSLSHFPEPRRALGEAVRVLQAGGRFVASAWGPGTSTPGLGAASEILGRHDAGEGRYRLDEDTWLDPERGSEVLRAAGLESVSVTTELFTGRFADVEEALEWSLAWPVRASRLDPLDPTVRASLLGDAREAIAAAGDLSWALAFNFYVAASAAAGDGT